MNKHANLKYAVTAGEMFGKNISNSLDWYYSASPVKKTSPVNMPL